jgi:glutaredoxin/pyruvate-formate lyase-activating enzyme
MGSTLYTATGCTRCKITKRFMAEQGIAFDEFDIKSEGREAFARFYRTNRSAIFRDKDGVEFPVFTDGSVIRQGVGVVIGHLIAGDGLDGFIGRSSLHGEWIDGINISGGDPARADELIQALSYLKQSRLKIQLIASGKNAELLEKVVARGLGDRMVMEVKGPAALYKPLTGQDIEARELEQSIDLATRFGEYQYYTTIAPLQGSDNQIRFLTPEEIGQTAQMIEAATGSKKHPYELRAFDPASAADEAFKSVQALPDSAMFKYRTAARRYQVMTEIQK